MVKEKNLGPQRGQLCQPNLQHLNPALRFSQLCAHILPCQKDLVSFSSEVK